jgi:23S rRNA pseudouridine1911/1915/1917 synthase
MKFVATAQGRVDKLLAVHLPQYSRAALAKLFETDLVHLDGKPVKPGHKAREGAIIEADLSSLEQEQQVVELPVLYEDENVVVIDKPAGIISHARGRYWYEPSVASFVRTKVALEGERAGIVHRLDRATSGVMICAKNEETMRLLQRQFSDRNVTKTYVAVLENIPKDHEATIDAPIERNPKKPSTFRIGANGKSAQTEYRVIQSSGHRSLVEFIPRTGRTHQLRIHAAFIGCPIVGDALYGTAGDRLLLHAQSLTICIPQFGKKTFRSRLPKEFRVDK